MEGRGRDGPPVPVTGFYDGTGAWATEGVGAERQLPAGIPHR